MLQHLNSPKMFRNSERSMDTARPSYLDFFIKRCIDVTMSIMLLLFFMLAFFLIIFAIKLSSQGPVFYCQRRSGLAGRPFTIYKFRTLYSNQCDAKFSVDCRQVADVDPRVTPLGVWLRRAGLDEIPQLINVLKGDMSLVGPRPHAISHDVYEGFTQLTLALSDGLWRA
jgi:putative colanic acid biosynthesis UDP-glucose lipid carrier transferase